ncbi:hypothetical protein ACFCXH_32100, partial [Streptomyces nojiriensis]
GATPGDGAGPEEYETAAPGASSDSGSALDLDSGVVSESGTETGFDPHSGGGGALSPDGRTLVLGGGSTGLTVWDLSDAGKARRTQTIPGTTPGGRLLFSEDGSILRSGARGWRLADAGKGKAEPLGDLPMPKGAHAMDVLVEGTWGALATTSGFRDFTTWLVRPGMEPVALGHDGFGEHPWAFALPPGRLLLGSLVLVVRDVTESVAAARDPRAAACAAVGGGLTRAELGTYDKDATWEPACPGADHR